MIHSDENNKNNGTIGNRIADAVERIAAILEKQAASVVSGVAPEALSKEDAARVLGMSIGGLEHLLRTRQLSYVVTGSQRGRLIPLESIREFLRSHRQPTGDELLKNRRKHA